MAPRSRIALELAPDDLAAFNAALAAGRLTVDSLTEWLTARGYDISRSSVGRYARDYSRLAARLRQSREMTDALVAELGPSAVEGKQGRLLVEMFRQLMADHLKAHLFAEGDGDGDALQPKDLAALGKALQAASSAARLDQDFVARIEEAARRALLAEQAEKLNAAATSGAMDPAAAAEARRVLGFA